MKGIKNFLGKSNVVGVVFGTVLIGLGLTPTAITFANDAPSAGSSSAGGADMTSTVVVPPWCGWTQSPAASGSIELSGTGMYTGAAYDLSANSGNIYAYVNGGSTITSEAAVDNCSWFGMTPLGASLSMTVDGNFSSSSDVGGADAAFAWNLADAGITFANNFVAGSCTNFTTNPGATATNNTPINVWSVDYADTITNNFCQYSIDYSTTIPGGLNPTYGDSTYTITGPSISIDLVTA